MFELIRSTIVRIKNLSSAETYGKELLKEAYLTEFLVYLNRCYSEIENEQFGKDVVYNKIIDKLIRHINENLSEDLSLETLSEKLFLSKYHLSREFKRITGFTLHRFILYKRLLTAKTLLREGKSVTHVCSECGFSDYSNFIRCFHKEFGVSPKRYATLEISAEQRTLE